MAKGLAELIVNKAADESPAEEPEDGEPEEMTPGLTDAADEMLAAMRAGSAADFAASLQSFVRMCRK